MNKEVKETIIQCAELFKSLRKSLIALIHKKYKTEKDEASISLLYAMEKSIMAIQILFRVRFKEKSAANYLKLPVGLLLRACCENAITLTYFLQIDKNTLHQELRNRKAEYSFSLLDRERVYIDNVNSIDQGFTEEFIKHLYELNLEDWFLDDLSLEATEYDLKAVKPTKERRQKKNIGKSKQIAEMYRTSKENNAYIESIYAYYKYFSQYEHFSFEGFGDAFASFERDNADFPSCVRTLNNWYNTINN